MSERLLRSVKEDLCPAALADLIKDTERRGYGVPVKLLRELIEASLNDQLKPYNAKAHLNAHWHVWSNGKDALEFNGRIEFDLWGISHRNDLYMQRHDRVKSEAEIRDVVRSLFMGGLRKMLNEARSDLRHVPSHAPRRNVKKCVDFYWMAKEILGLEFDADFKRFENDNPILQPERHPQQTGSAG